MFNISWMVDRTPNKSDKETTPYTLSTVKITEVIKGDNSVGDVITIKQIGDFKKMPEDFLHKTNGYLTTGTEQLMFLKSYENFPYSPLSPQQGIVEIRKGELFSNSRYSLFGYYSENETSHDTLDSAISEIAKHVE